MSDWCSSAGLWYQDAQSSMRSLHGIDISICIQVAAFVKLHSSS
jgi:hypothetical protein